jgi:hypothetical protein
VGSVQKKNPAHAVGNRKRLFLLTIVDGVDPESACKAVWPHTVGVAEKVAKIMSDEVFQKAYSYLMAHKFTKEALLHKCNQIIGNGEYRATEKVNALKLAAQLSGHITAHEKTVSKKRPEAKSDEVNWKLVELARKAEILDGPQKKPS